MSENVETKKSGFGTAGLVLGIIAMVISFIPFINTFAYIMGILALIFGIVALAKKASKGPAVAALILGILSIAMTASINKSAVDVISGAVNQLNEDFATMGGERTDEILINSLEVNIGNFEAIDRGYGFFDTKLPVTLRNKTNETKSFSVQIEAVNKDGSRISTEYVYANNLTAGQSQNFEAFSLVTSDKVNAYKNATFKIVEVSMY